jgi:hypothetical protein
MEEPFPTVTGSARVSASNGAPRWPTRASEVQRDARRQRLEQAHRRGRRRIEAVERRFSIADPRAAAPTFIRSPLRDAQAIGAAVASACTLATTSGRRGTSPRAPSRHHERRLRGRRPARRSALAHRENAAQAPAYGRPTRRRRHRGRPTARTAPNTSLTRASAARAPSRASTTTCASGEWERSVALRHLGIAARQRWHLGRRPAAARPYRNDQLGVVSVAEAAASITGSADVQNGALRRRRPAQAARGPAEVIIIAADGTWHRAITTLELALLQDMPARINGKPLVLAGIEHDGLARAHRQRGARRRREGDRHSLLLALLASKLGTWFLSSEGGLGAAARPCSRCRLRRPTRRDRPDHRPRALCPEPAE